MKADLLAGVAIPWPVSIHMRPPYPVAEEHATVRVVSFAAEPGERVTLRIWPGHIEALDGRPLRFSRRPAWDGWRMS
jgi:hypothetical protein